MNTDIISMSMLDSFVNWLESYGEVSFDHQSFFAGPIGGKAKGLYYKNKILGIFAVAPMIFLEAFIPSGRRLFWKKQRFPIADAHYAMGFALLSELTGKEQHYQKAVHFLEELIQSRSPGCQNYCWGYPFDWVTQSGTIKANTPFITSLPYAYEAFDYVYRLDKKEKWLDIMRSIAEHAYKDLHDVKKGNDAYSCGYYPDDSIAGVINASAYRAFVLTAAGKRFNDENYLKAANGNLNFVLQSQNENGSWYYAVEDNRDFVDHFHTCFVLKALSKIEILQGFNKCRFAIDKGINYYVENLFDINGHPKPFSKAPRITVYQNELYDYAECINLGALLIGRYQKLDDRIQSTLEDLYKRWIKKDGSFRSRKLKMGWDNEPMHRWAQSQIFRSICLYKYRSEKNVIPV